MGTFNLYIAENQSQSQNTDWGVGGNISSITDYFATNGHGVAKRPIKKVTFEMSSNVTTNWGYATIQLKACFANSSSDANYESKSERFLYKEFRTDKEPNQIHSVDVTKYFNRNYPYSITSEAKGYSQFWVYFNTTSVNKKTYLIHYAKFVVTYEDDQMLQIAVNPLNSGTIEGPGLSINGGWYVGSYVYETTNSFKAVPANEYKFAYWKNLDTEELLYNNPLSIYHTKTYGYQANFEINKYTITALASPTEGGTVTGGGEHGYGETIALQANPALGWCVSDWLKDGVSLKTDAEYIRPTVSENATYTVVFKKCSYTITFKDGDGKTLQSSNWEYDTTPSYSGSTPTKTSTAEYTYSWNTSNPWTPAISKVTGTQTYTANFNSAKRKYLIKFVNYDDSPLESKEVEYGTKPAYTGSTPVKPSDNQYDYTFSGWTPVISNVTGAATYKATFTSTLRTFTVSVTEGTISIISGNLVNGKYTHGSKIKITANEKTGYKFINWSGSSSSTQKEIEYTVTSNASFVANYRQLQIKFKSVKILHHSTNEVASPTNPLNGGQDQAIVQVKITLE